MPRRFRSDSPPHVVVCCRFYTMHRTPHPLVPQMVPPRPGAPPNSPSCTNNHEDCEYWASIGGCGDNPEYMLNNCMSSCDTCYH